MADWNPDYLKIVNWRNDQIIDYSKHSEKIEAAKVYYKHNPVEFIEHWMNTYDPRNAGSEKPSSMPFVLFPKQREFVEYIYQLIDHQEDGLVEKSRDMGATWVSAAISVHLFLFWDGASIGWGSRKEQLVDKLGDLDSIFEKMRMIFRGLPNFFLPNGFNEKSMSYMKIINTDTGAAITGESGDNIGRGGRSLIYFKDEAAHYERPEKIEAALADNTNVQIDISSVNGLGNVFHRRRENGADWCGEIVPGRVNVFVMDWRDHPLKDQAWYDRRKAKAESDGLLHVFEQEVNRNYAASVEGVLIPYEWVEAAVDAHIKLGFSDDGGYMAGLDVADEGIDTNAQCLRKGVVLRSITEWNERDVGVTTRKSIEALKGITTGVQYDCIGIGATVKAEINRLNDDGLLPSGLSYVAWNAGAGVIDPDERVIPDDDESPINKDFYTNLKAQASWQLRLRFERTYRAVKDGVVYESDDLISIDSTIPLLPKLKKELSQSTYGTGSKLKLLINKTPDGTRSPNLSDAVVQCYFPIEAGPSPQKFDSSELGVFM